MKTFPLLVVVASAHMLLVRADCNVTAIYNAQLKAFNDIDALVGGAYGDLYAKDGFWDATVGAPGYTACCGAANVTAFAQGFMHGGKLASVKSTFGPLKIAGGAAEGNGGFGSYEYKKVFTCTNGKKAHVRGISGFLVDGTTCKLPEVRDWTDGEAAAAQLAHCASEDERAAAGLAPLRPAAAAAASAADGVIPAAYAAQLKAFNNIDSLTDGTYGALYDATGVWEATAGSPKTGYSGPGPAGVTAYATAFKNNVGFTAVSSSFATCTDKALPALRVNPFAGSYCYEKTFTCKSNGKHVVINGNGGFVVDAKGKIATAYDMVDAAAVGQAISACFQ